MVVSVLFAVLLHKTLIKKPESENALLKRKVLNLDLKQSTVEHILQVITKPWCDKRERSVTVGSRFSLRNRQQI